MMTQERGSTGVGLAAMLAMPLLVAGLVGPVHGASKSPAAASRPLLVSQAPVVLLRDMDSGATLFSRGADKEFAPASMAKVMTAYVVLDLIDRGELSRNSKFTVKRETWERWNGSNGGSTMFLKVGEQVTVDDLLKGLLAVSGNDAAAALAVGIDGSEAAFVERMNRVARSIGMTSSSFGTPNGWPDGGKTKVTAGDLVRLADRLIRDFPAGYARYFSIPSFSHGRTIDGKPIVQPNGNPILGRIEGADGLKTGHTNEAGYCLLGSAIRNGRRLIMVVAGMKSAKARQEETARLMNWGFEQWKVMPVLPSSRTIGSLEVTGGSAPTVAVQTKRPVTISLPQGHRGKYRTVIRYHGPLQAPVREGAPVAHLVITPDGLPPQITPLFAVTQIDEGNLWDRARTGLYRMTGL